MQLRLFRKPPQGAEPPGKPAAAPQQEPVAPQPAAQAAAPSSKWFEEPELSRYPRLEVEAISSGLYRCYYRGRVLLESRDAEHDGARELHRRGIGYRGCFVTVTRATGMVRARVNIERACRRMSTGNTEIKAYDPERRVAVPSFRDGRGHTPTGG